MALANDDRGAPGAKAHLKVADWCSLLIISADLTPPGVTRNVENAY